MQKQNIGLDKNLLHPARIMFLDYEFNYNGRVYFARGIDIGETIDIESEKKDMESNKKSAICNALDLSIDEFEEKNFDLSTFEFKYCELY